MIGFEMKNELMSGRNLRKVGDHVKTASNVISSGSTRGVLCERMAEGLFETRSRV